MPGLLRHDTEGGLGPHALLEHAHTLAGEEREIMLGG